MRLAVFARRAGLGLLVGAVLHGTAHAQVRRDTTQRDTTRRDTSVVPVPAADTTKQPRDTLKPPLLHAESPALLEIGDVYRWDRNSIFSSGAVTLSDLLSRVPGVTGFRSSWISSPHADAYLGDFGRVRVFLDGIEIDPIDLRTGGMLDLSLVQMWTLEEVAVERGAGELRVHLRTWGVQRTTPFTRIDVATGDLETNTYRGYYGKRYRHGESLQVGAQQFSTTDLRVGGDGDQLSLFGRAGWVRGRWSVDGVFNRTRRNLALQRRLDGLSVLPPQDAQHTMAYARAGYGAPGTGTWFQLIAASQKFAESADRRPTSTNGIPVDTVDSAKVRSQYVLTGGTSRWGLDVSATARLRVFYREQFLSPSARLAYRNPVTSISLFAERSEGDSAMHSDAIVRITPLRYLALTGAASRASPILESSAPTSLTVRGEVGIRVGRLWISGGLIRSDTAHLRAPIVFDTTFKPAAVGPRTATLVSLRGPVWKGIGLDVQGLRWDGEYAYTPQYQVRSVLSAQTSWLSKFPDGNFNILFAVQHDYRTAALFPTGVDASLQSSQYRLLSSLLEIRLYDATLYWQYRNFLAEVYESVPGFEAPRQVNYYGVRWQFFN